MKTYPVCWNGHYEQLIGQATLDSEKAELTVVITDKRVIDMMKPNTVGIAMLPPLSFEYRGEPQ